MNVFAVMVPCAYGRVDMIQSALGRGLLEGYDQTRHVLLLAAHLHVTGASFSQNDRPLHVTDTYATHYERIPPVSYAAYGHIHRPQALRGPVAGRFAGSAVQLDFGEVGEEKGVVIVDAAPGRPPEVSIRRLSAGRPLKRIQGTLPEIEALAPAVGRSSSSTARPVVDFPQPLSPTRPKVSCRPRVKPTPSTACTVSRERNTLPAPRTP